MPTQDPYHLSHTLGWEIIQSRAPIFAITTALGCVLAACILASRGLLEWVGALLAVAGLPGIWQRHVAWRALILVIQGQTVTHCREGEDARSYKPSGLSIVAPDRPRAIYIDDRQQRERMLVLRRAGHLEQVILRVGLGPDVITVVPQNTNSLRSAMKGAPNET